MKIYLVGGAVRDKQLGLEPKERDWVVVGSTPDKMLAMGYQQVGKDFPVFLHPQTHEEYALARTERKTAPGYTGFEFHANENVTLEEDLCRRDLTINAMAEDSDGMLIDPYHGLDDLNAGLLKHISPAFSEDPVRILRIARFAARFSQWGFRVAHSTHKLMRKMVENGEVDALIPERVWAETEKALTTSQPWRFFEVLHSCDALDRIFPEIANEFSNHSTGHQANNSPIAIMDCLKQACVLTADKTIRFAAMTALINESIQSVTSKNTDAEKTVQLIQSLCKRLRIPNEYRDLAVITARHFTKVISVDSFTPHQLLQILLDTDAFRRAERFAGFLLACEAIYKHQSTDESDEFSAGKTLMEALQVCQQVDTKDLQDSGLSGQQFASALSQLRVEALGAIAQE